MARPLRIEYDGAWYHVMNRGADRRTIFRSRSLEQFFLKLLGEAYDRYGLEVNAYCLMPNHYHLLAHTPQAGLSRAMRHLDGRYAQWFNKITGTDGPLFRGRYHALLIDDDAYLLQVSRYIHLNPVEAGLVSRPQDFEPSSSRAYLHEPTAPAWLKTEAVLGRFDSDDPRDSYRRFVEAGIDEWTRETYSRERLPPVLGDREFRRKIAARLEQRITVDVEIPDVKRLSHRVDLAEIVRVVCDLFDEAPAGSGKGLEHSVDSRGAIAYLGRRLGGCGLTEIARCLGYRSYSGVTKVERRLMARMAADFEMRASVQEAVRRLTRDTTDSTTPLPVRESGVISRPDP